MSDDIIISVGTMPARLPYIKPCIDSLRAQGLPLYVWIPKHVERTDDWFDYEFPDFLKGVKGAVVRDRGPIGKLLSALPQADVILAADDDCIYGEGWAGGLLEHAETFPGMALGYRGRVFRDRKYNHSVCVTQTQMPLSVDLLTGTWGCLYRAEWFDRSIYEEWEQWPLNDDIVINAHLKRQGIPRVVIPRRCDIQPYDVHRINALWDVNIDSNDAGLEALGWWA